MLEWVERDRFNSDLVDRHRDVVLRWCGEGAFQVSNFILFWGSKRIPLLGAPVLYEKTGDHWLTPWKKPWWPVVWNIHLGTANLLGLDWYSSEELERELSTDTEAKVRSLTPHYTFSTERELVETEALVRELFMAYGFFRPRKGETPNTQTVEVRFCTKEELL